VPDAVAIRVDPKPIHTASAPDTWWRHAVIYQIYPRSWSDSGGDGIGDLPGITERFEYLARLGVDAVWLSPFYVSPQNDGGYDVADYRDVDPVFGRLEDADKLIATAHDYGIRIIIDLVPNHSSSEHPWFQAALRAAPGSPERARYIFRDGRGASGALPPNNWLSNFGGAGWTRVTEADGRLGQWYLHIFDVTQPDFDWSNDEVRAEMEAVIRFWLDRGIDGFRIDVAHGLVKRAGLPDGVTRQQPTGEPTARQPMWDQPGVHEIYRAWRKLLNSYNASGPDAELADEDRILCAEAWVHPPEALARYVRPDELHQSFNFDFLLTPWLAPELCDVIEHTLRVADDVGAPQTWVLSNHDVVRYATRLGYPAGAGLLRFSGIGADDAQPDAALGLRRARAAAAVMTQPGDDRDTPSVAATAVAFRCRGSLKRRPTDSGRRPGAGCRSRRRFASSQSTGRTVSTVRLSSSIGRTCRLAGSTVSVTVGCTGSTDIRTMCSRSSMPRPTMIG
jgi:alpha-glucosidase